MMKFDLTIGIPTYERPELLARLLKSIADQKGVEQYNLEIAIGDDSELSVYNYIVDLVKTLPGNIVVNYLHQVPAKGQNHNVASLMNRARGKYFCLMHDDDFLLDAALSSLMKAAIENTQCIVFGKQVSFGKTFDYKNSDKTNEFFKRSSTFKGKQEDSVAMAMLQQCPNDGYILETKFARSIGIRDKNIIGTACDFDFALRAAVVAKLDFFFIDQYTTVYAITDDSVTTSANNNAGERKLQILYEFRTNESHPKTFHQVLKTDLSMIISHYILMDNKIAAKKNLFSASNFFNYLWYKPGTYKQLYKLILNKR